MSVSRALVCACIGIVLAITSAPAQEPAQILVLGTYHFANPGLDVVQVEVADVLSDTRQAEILEIVDALHRFEPTKVAVEHEPETTGRIDSLYQAYRAGEHAPSRNETEQVGYRLAAMGGHPHVYPVDHAGEFPFGAVMEYAQAHDPDFLVMVGEERAKMEDESNRQQREYTVGEILRFANDPDSLAASHGMYMRFARVGAGDTYVGAELLAKWYERNIHIFTNLQALAEPGDRILLIIGSGHAPILRELIEYDPALQLVDPLDYLP